MSFTLIVGIVLFVVLVAGVLLWMLSPPQPVQQQCRGKKRIPLLLPILCIIVVGMFIFYLASGYTWLAGLVGQANANTLFLVFSVILPAISTIICGIYFAFKRHRLSVFIMAWLSLVGGTLGSMVFWQLAV